MTNQEIENEFLQMIKQVDAVCKECDFPVVLIVCMEKELDGGKVNQHIAQLVYGNHDSIKQMLAKSYAHTPSIRKLIMDALMQALVMSLEEPENIMPNMN